MKEAQNFLESWVNDTANDRFENDLKEYSEKEVEEMLYDYKLKFSLPVVVSTFICHDADTYREGEKCIEMCVDCRNFN